ncbi:putative integral membrane protein [Acanthocheilonema viteae]
MDGKNSTGSQFLIFVVSHLLLMFGAAISKLVVILLATSIELKAPGNRFKKKCYFGEGKPRNAETTVSVVCALRYPKERGGTVLMLFMMECCRSTGVSILFFHIFPSLDPLHCLILSVFVVFIPLYLKINKLIRCSFDPIWTLKKRVKLLVCLCGYSVLFWVVFASCYMWSITAVHFFKYIALLLGLILSSFGFWDLWINEEHSISSYRYLYQLKYGTRKMSSMTRLMVSVLRILTSSAIVWIIYFRFVGHLSEFCLTIYIVSVVSNVNEDPSSAMIFIATCFITPACSIRGY